MKNKVLFIIIFFCYITSLASASEEGFSKYINDSLNFSKQCKTNNKKAKELYTQFNKKKISLQHFANENLILFFATNLYSDFHSKIEKIENEKNFMNILNNYNCFFIDIYQNY